MSADICPVCLGKLPVHSSTCPARVTATSALLEHISENDGELGKGEPRGLRELMQTYGLKMVRQKIAGGRSRVWLLGVMLTDGEERHRVVNGDGDGAYLAQLDYLMKLRGQTLVIEREYPDTCTVSLPMDFGAQDMVGSIPFDEMYDADNPPPAPSSSALERAADYHTVNDYISKTATATNGFVKALEALDRLDPTRGGSRVVKP